LNNYKFGADFILSEMVADASHSVCVNDSVIIDPRYCVDMPIKHILNLIANIHIFNSIGAA